MTLDRERLESLYVALFETVRRPQYEKLPATAIIGTMELVKHDILHAVKGDGYDG